MKLEFSTVACFFMTIILISLSACTSAQKLQENAPTNFGKVYFQKWNSGVQGGGSGLHIYIPVEEASVTLDSVYFRGQVSALKQNPNNELLFIGSFKTAINAPKDLIMSDDPNKERENKLPSAAMNSRFKLDDDQCVVSYKKESKTVYYKISNLEEAQQINYPSTAPNN
ncbi:hypothetical protein ESY86_07725 [Subsaximicrobium wynnwilliamsii]|uniref:Lipoprotein n=1 Tax=Subsaximicrobium wynnwilliamsii TaxID=291179 RepID=A0A5C6ZIJ6_9FLAO|nr:hypothetical protein [Subsaximicrobium wynnwilliamsii]TXD83923.1 hypothetical protein ESY87_07890 [Subsaximicrobium wynnwilliamsii]TXD89663.1 hypothetical protein ESY86_07725 [Subsaximicrobium wynnwilliamsii]TXE01648.1 hypothetical protein ESY88_14790 [Subsaximicrobium wynnwilliamsii]